MTYSGQGDEPQYPAARPAHEGVVLPSDGSGPWIPGSAADQNPPAPTPVPAALPPTGGRQPDVQPWGQPQQPQQAYGHDPHAPHAPHGAQGAPQGYGAPAGSPSYDQPYQQSYPQGGQEPYGAYGAPEPTPSYGRPGGAPYDTAPPQQQPYGQPTPQPQAQPLPQPYGETPQYSEPQPYPGSPQPQGYGEPQPPGMAQPPQQGGYGQPMPLPAEAPAPGSADATQYLPPIPAAPAGAGDSDATQFIAPVPPASPGSRGPGVLPPESRDNGSDATQFLPPVAAAPGSDAEATQFIAPVPAGPAPAGAPSPSPYGVRPGAPGDRPPPAEFDNLFRTDGPASGSTQKMPRIETPAPPVGGRRARGGGAGHQPRPQPPAPSYGDSPSYGDQATQGGPAPHEPRGRSAGRRTSSRVPLIATVTVGIVALGLGAGALMSGGDDDAAKDGSKTVAAATSPPATGSTAQAAPDPVKTQAVALDKLLADSSSSRESVINAVNSIRTCDNLGQAATDLHAAAEQRRGLVTRLDALTVDKLPSHTELTSALTDAWEASASADDHYAAWAEQVGKKKGCKDGQARVTSERSKGDRASGEATAAKKKASGLWNGIATRYGLTERAPTQL